ncbi:hypothetical protein [Bizionia arctica]|uniref:Uncharacterized protein n=1 Tax=Bizionia arctica TaxID=1495645 RepID=A0A917LKH8_9FLAO|nr:hypothetical protein [Bizionia arctica]GGG35754.1 hypothetical protein GCM10010976_04360 [Bizionia arctica]
MKFYFTFLLIVSQVIFLAVFGCSENDEPVSCNDRQIFLAEQRDQIRAFAETSICSDDFECRYIGFGSKPCGGPWEYLIYSTTIDTLELTNWVNDFNNMEEIYNQEGCGGMSPCNIPPSPIDFECQDNKCIPIY